MKIHSKGIFKHPGIIHLLPLVKIILENMKTFYYLTFELTWFNTTIYITFEIQ